MCSHLLALAPTVTLLRVTPALAPHVLRLQNAGMIGESSGKLLSHLSSKSLGNNPSQTITLACGGVNDAAFSPDGGRLAVACRDGSVRLLDWPSGQCLGGYQVGGWGLGLRVQRLLDWLHGQCLGK